MDRPWFDFCDRDIIPVKRVVEALHLPISYRFRDLR